VTRLLPGVEPSDITAVALGHHGGSFLHTTLATTTQCPRDTFASRTGLGNLRDDVGRNLPQTQFYIINPLPGLPSRSRFGCLLAFAKPLRRSKAPKLATASARVARRFSNERLVREETQGPGAACHGGSFHFWHHLWCKNPETFVGPFPLPPGRVKSLACYVSLCMHIRKRTVHFFLLCYH
jgi:hypothetical protein